MVAAPVARRSTPTLLALRALGALLLLGVAVIHGYLWQQGYRDIGIIGPAFLLDTVLAAGGALLLLVTPSRWLYPVAAAGALLCLGTLGALLVSTTVGLFGFVESTAAPLWWESFWVEAAGAVVLTALALITRRR
jgi:hypothetical protein